MPAKGTPKPPKLLLETTLSRKPFFRRAGLSLLGFIAALGLTAAPALQQGADQLLVVADLRECQMAGQLKTDRRRDFCQRGEPNRYHDPACFVIKRIVALIKHNTPK